MPAHPTPLGGLYIIRLSDTHYYGGRSTNCPLRWKTHLRDLRAGTHDNSRMQAVFNIHGRFEPTVTVPWTEGLDLRAVEQQWLDENFRKPGCVNQVCTSDGGGGKWSDEQKVKRRSFLDSHPDVLDKAREVLRKHHAQAVAESEVVRQRPGGYTKIIELNRARAGVPQKPEHVARRAESNRGRKNTAETVQRMSESAKVRAQAHPTVHGVGTRELISSQQRGRVWVHNATINRRVWPHEAQELMSQGWEPNRLPNRV